jgi:hypothetical protein
LRCEIIMINVERRKTGGFDAGAAVGGVRGDEFQPFAPTSCRDGPSREAEHNEVPEGVKDNGGRNIDDKQ